MNHTSRSAEDRRYRTLLRVESARQLLGYGLVGRLPLSMFPVGLVVFVAAASGSYGLGGAVSAAFSIAFAMAAPITGRFLDKFGQRRMGRLLLLAFVLSSSAMMASVALSAPAVISILLAFAGGATVPNIGVWTRSQWTDKIPEQSLEQSQALESVNDEISFIIGPPAVSIIAATFAAWIPLVAAMVASILGTLGVSSLERSVVSQSERPTAGRWLRWPRVPILVSLVGIGGTLSAILVFVVAYTDMLGAPAWAAAFFVLNATTSLLAGLAVGRIRGGDLQRRYWIFAALYPAVVIPLVLVQGLGMFLISAIISGLVIAPAFIQANSYIAMSTPTALKTEAFSWISGSVALGLASGSAMSGWAVDSFGPDQARLWVFLPACVTGAVAMVSLAISTLKGQR